MRSNKTLLRELQQNSVTEGTTANDPLFEKILQFYEDHPQYTDLDATGAAYIIKIFGINNKPIQVHKFPNGALYFVGDFGDDKDIPISSIGDWTCNNGWHEDLKEQSTIIDTITF